MKMRGSTTSLLVVILFIATPVLAAPLDEPGGWFGELGERLRGIVKSLAASQDDDWFDPLPDPPRLQPDPSSAKPYPEIEPVPDPPAAQSGEGDNEG